MGHFALIAPPAASHVTAMTTIAGELSRRGHQATLFSTLDAEDLARKEGTAFRALGAAVHPKGTLKRFNEGVSQLNTLQQLRFGLKFALEEIDILLGEGPEALRQAGGTALVIDQVLMPGSTLAHRLNLPFVTLCNAIACDPDPLVPPPNTDWDVPKTWLGRLRNRATYRSVDVGFTPMRRRINSYRKKWGLPPIRSFYESFSPLLEIAQETEEFDLPRAKLPPQFRYVGLLRRQTVSSIPFPFERLDGRPIVYGSLGTVVSDTRGLFQGMSEACAALNLQLVITLGHSADIEKYANLPGQPIVVSYAPQFELLRRAALTICHGGHNTVLDSLDYGVPVIAIPLFSDNHGAAVRLQRSGAGERILPKEFNAERLRGTIHRMLAESRYQERARAMQASLKHAGGIARAVDLIEAAVSRSA